MRDFEWDDVAFLLELVRTGSMAGAARSLGVHAATVSRRLRRLEEALEATLFERTVSGPTLTATGERVLELARQAEANMQQLRAVALAQDRVVRGEVVLATAPMLAQHLVVPALPRLARQWPELQLRLSTTVRHLSLAEGGIDLAFRLVPEGRDVSTPGMVARRVGTVHFRLCRQAGEAPMGPVAAQPMVRYANVPWEPGHAWFDSLPVPPPVAATANDQGVLAAMVEAGIGLGVLPDFVLRGRPGLVPMGEPVDAASLWVVFPPAHRHVARFRAVADWLVELGSSGEAPA